MTRAECEKILSGLLKEMVNVYKVYNPEGRYLIASFSASAESGEAYFNVNNSYFKKDEGIPINYFRRVEGGAEE